MQNDFDIGVFYNRLRLLVYTLHIWHCLNKVRKIGVKHQDFKALGWGDFLTNGLVGCGNSLVQPCILEGLSCTHGGLDPHHHKAQGEGYHEPKHS